MAIRSGPRARWRDHPFRRPTGLDRRARAHGGGRLRLTDCRTSLGQPHSCADGAFRTRRTLWMSRQHFASPRREVAITQLNVAKRIGRTCLSLYASAMSRPCTVSAQITKIDTAMNTIAHTGYQGSHANATSAHNTAMITPTVRAHTAPLNR